MVWRFHFTVQDLARTRLAEAPMPLVELVAAMRALQDRHAQPVRLGAWRQNTLAALPPDARRVLALAPPLGMSPSFLAPLRAGAPSRLLEHLLTATPEALDADLRSIADSGQHVPSWARDLADDIDLRREFHHRVGHLFDRLVGPYWERLAAHFEADRAVRVRQLLDGGVEQLLSLANPLWLCWKPPVLEMRTVRQGADVDVHLGGTGLLLVPSTFHARPAFHTGEPQPVLTYVAGIDQPLSHLTALAPKAPAATTTAALTALLGRTRAAVLNTIATRPGSTTKDLAALVGISPANASEHATVLREAGLIQTVRHRNTALHSPTRLGVSLLDTPSPPAPGAPPGATGPGTQ
ncbi:MarR family transcriptional regulator [Streptomyces sp. NPDC048111]|uniref:MarR family transcriptional regulator n=1 Tax=Streptomyces sp. NPDC048111 TaxID=3365500 RepID=UPI0037108C2C